MLTRKKFSIAVAVAGVFVLAGCAAPKVEAPAPKVRAPEVTVETPTPVTTPEVTVETPDARQVGLDVLRGMDPVFEHVPDDAIFTASEGICTAFDDGLSFETVVLVAMGEGLSAEQAGYLVGFAVNVDCPEWAGVTG